MNETYDHDAANEQKWSQRAATFDDKRFDYFRIMQGELIASAGISSPSRFLDLGCGTGWTETHQEQPGKNILPAENSCWWQEFVESIIRQVAALPQGGFCDG